METLKKDYSNVTLFTTYVKRSKLNQIDLMIFNTMLWKTN